MTQHRFEFLDGLRGVAAITVVLYHFTQHAACPIAKNAYFAVDLFFCISGFVLAKAYSGRIKQRSMGVREFLSKRVARLYPMFFLGLMLGVISLFVTQAYGQTTFSTGQILASAAANLFYIPFPNHGSIIIGGLPVPGPIFPANNPAWTLFFEMVVNVMFFGLWRSGKLSIRVLRLIVAISGLIFAAAIAMDLGSLGWGSDLPQALVGLIRTIYGFSAGVVIAQVPHAKIPETLQSTAAALIAIAVLALSFLPGDKVSFFAAVAIAPFIVWAGTGVLAPNAVYRWGGEVSYPLYCLHFPIFLMLSVTGIINSLNDALIACGLCVMAAFAVAVLIEIPVRRRVSSIRNQRGR